MREECLDCNKSLEDCTCIEDTIELPNQALIDAAERYIAGDNYNRYYDDFIEGANWMQERMYSEEDMLKSFMAGIKCESKNGKNFEQFIKQLKNK
jgi:hypothetical protein